MLLTDEKLIMGGCKHFQELLRCTHIKGSQVTDYEPFVEDYMSCITREKV